MTSVSPALSSATRSTETTNSSTSKTASSTTAATTTAAAVINNFNYAELFEDVDWNEVNLIDIEREWRNELDQIEKDNVQALMDSTSKAQLVLPAVFKAIEDITKLSDIYEKYTTDLRTAGLEIQQIELLNRGLEAQTRNLEVLSEEVQKIISLVALPDGVLEILQTMPLDAPISIPKIERAAQSLYNLLNVKFEGGIQDIKAISDRLRYYNEQHDLFAKRLVKFFTAQFSDIASKQGTSSARTFVSAHLTSPNPTSGSLGLPRHDEIYNFLAAYKSLIILCRHQSPREHLEICTQYQNTLGNLVSKDLGRLFETLKTVHLIKRPNPEPSALFVNPNLKGPQFSLNVGRTYLPSNKNFSSMQLLKVEDLPFLAESEYVYPDQALHFIILIVAMSMSSKRKLSSELLFGYELPDDFSACDLKMSKKLIAIQGIVHGSLGDRLPQFVDYCIKLDESSAIDLLAVLDLRVPQCMNELPMLGKILEAIQQTVYNYSELFLESQIEAIKATKYSAKKRSGIFGYVETFPRFVKRIESILNDSGIKSTDKNYSVRVLVDRYYEKIGQVIFDSFLQLDREIEESDEKGHINASVMTTENSYYLFKKFTEANLNLDAILRSSKSFYETSLASYARLSIYRAVGRYAEYFDGLSNLLKTTAAEEVAFTSTYSKASVKKVIQSRPLKELKKDIDLLHSRVIKHFYPHQNLTAIVWTAVKDDFLTRERTMRENLGKVFPGAVDVKPNGVCVFVCAYPLALDTLDIFDMPFWSTEQNSNPFPFSIKRFINYIDDTMSPVLRSRNCGVSSPKRAISPISNCDDKNVKNSPPETPKSPFKSVEDKVAECLYGTEVVDVDKLKKLSWSGLPSQYRPLCWKILMGYLPPNLDRHESILIRKRREYRDITTKYFGDDDTKMTLKDLSERAKSRVDFNELILHQISIDIPRTCPESTLFQVPIVQGSLLRILYCWSIRRPATGYVQGINDLATPFYSVFLNSTDPENLDEDTRFAVEADTFWCLSNLLDTIQDSYTFNQSGIYRQVTLLREISLRMDPQLVKHLETEGVEFIQFAFRWMNCLLLREFRLSTVQRLWDTYLSEGPDGFKTFHPYICAAFLLKWRRELQNLEFQDIIVFLQRPPTQTWTDRDVELLVAEAFVLKNLFNK